MERIKPKPPSDIPASMTFSITQGLLDKMDEESERVGMSRSELLREILIMYFKEPVK